MKKLLNCIFILLAAVALSGLTSCHTSKRAASGGNAGVARLPNDPLLTREIGDGEAAALLREAFGWLGTPYSYGGHSKKGTDCSGFVMEVYKKACDIMLPRNSAAQSEYCKKVKDNDLRVGDLVFFSNKGKGRISHVGLYVGNGEMIHASTSRGVIVSRLSDKYYTNNYNSAGRVKNFSTSKSSKKKQKQEAAPIPQPQPRAKETPKASTKPQSAPSISLDDLIDAKIDSIFSAGFMD